MSDATTGDDCYGDGMSHDERRRLHRCRAAALLCPVVAAAVSMGLYFAGLSVPGLSLFDPAADAILLANGVVGTAASVACRVLLHLLPQRPILISVGYLLLAPVVYIGSMFLLFVAGVIALSMAELAAIG